MSTKIISMNESTSKNLEDDNAVIVIDNLVKSFGDQVVWIRLL